MIQLDCKHKVEKSDGLMNIEFNESEKNYPFKFYDIGLNWVQHKVYRPSGFKYYHWLQTARGVGHIEIGSKKFKLYPHQGFLMRPNVPYSCYPDSDNEWLTSFLTFEGTATDSIETFLELNNYQLYLSLDPELENFIQQNYKTFSLADYPSSLDQSALVYKFVTLLKKNAFSNKTQFTTNNINNSIIEYIRVHYREKITNQTLSLVAGYSVPHTIRLFKNEVGETPMEYLNKFRLRMAKTLIDFRDELSIEEVSELVGYRNLSYFIQQYKKFYNLTPGQERRIGSDSKEAK
ncbi:hypothetical protein GCM10022297_07820 [Lactobacillus hamsteri]